MSQFTQENPKSRMKNWRKNTQTVLCQMWLLIQKSLNNSHKLDKYF